MNKEEKLSLALIAYAILMLVLNVPIILGHPLPLFAKIPLAIALGVSTFFMWKYRLK